MSAVEPTVMSADEARERFARVGAAVSNARDDLTALYAGRAWLSLGYGSWDEACDAMLGVRVALPREERREVVGGLRQAGMSTRAIGSALGIGNATVHRDLAATVSDETDATPERVTSLDGRERPATQPPRPVETPMPVGLDGAAGASVAADPGEGSVIQPVPSGASSRLDDGALASAVAAVLDEPNADRDAAQYRINLVRAIERIQQLAQFDPERTADLIEDDHADLIDRSVRAITEWAEQVRRRRSGLRVVKGVQA